MKTIILFILFNYVAFSQSLITLLGDDAFKPNNISGLYAWYDPSQETVSEITTLQDFSGNSKTLSQSTATQRPEVVNGLTSKLFSFRGADSSDVLYSNTGAPTFTNGVPQSITIFELDSVITLGSSARWGALSIGYVGSGVGATTYNFGSHISCSVVMSVPSTSIAATIGSALVDPYVNKWELVCYEMIYDGGTTFTLKATNIKSGTQTNFTPQVVTKSFTGTITDNGSTTGFMVLGARTHVDNYIKKYIGEVLMYVKSTAMTDEEKAKVFKYYKDKWKYY